MASPETRFVHFLSWPICLVLLLVAIKLLERDIFKFVPWLKSKASLCLLSPALQTVLDIELVSKHFLFRVFSNLPSRLIFSQLFSCRGVFVFYGVSGDIDAGCDVICLNA